MSAVAKPFQGVLASWFNRSPAAGDSSLMGEPPAYMQEDQSNQRPTAFQNQIAQDKARAAVGASASAVDPRYSGPKYTGPTDTITPVMENPAIGVLRDVGQGISAAGSQAAQNPTPRRGSFGKRVVDALTGNPLGALGLEPRDQNASPTQPETVDATTPSAAPNPLLGPTNARANLEAALPPGVTPSEATVNRGVMANMPTPTNPNARGYGSAGVRRGPNFVPAPVATGAPIVPAGGVAPVPLAGGVFMRNYGGSVQYPDRPFLTNPETGMVTSSPTVGAGLDTRLSSEAAIRAQDTLKGDAALRDRAGVMSTPGAGNVKTLYDATTGSSMSVSDPNNRVGQPAAAAGLSPEEYAARMNVVGARIGPNAGVLHGTPEEAAQLNKWGGNQTAGILAPMYRGAPQQASATTAAAQSYDQIGNRMANDDNARRMAAQGVVNQGVQAQQQALRDRAQIPADARVTATDHTNQSRERIAAMTNTTRQAIADQVQKGKDQAAAAGLDVKSDAMNRHMMQVYAQEHVKLLHEESVTAGSFKQNIPILQSAFKPWIDFDKDGNPTMKGSSGKSAGKSSSPAVPVYVPPAKRAAA